MKMKRRYLSFSPIALLILASLACGLMGTPSATPTPPPADTPAPSPTPAPPTETPTTLPTAPVQPGEANPDEPVFITGDIPYTSPFFANTLNDPLVLLEDQAGFVARNFEFTFKLEGQVIGPVEVLDDDTVIYSLALPAVPQGTFVDVDNNGQEDQGVQVFAVAYWSNTWGGPFLDERDAGGWSGGHVSTVVDSERDGEIVGGILVVWAPDGEQSFPTGFGEDDMLFTEDDPVASIPAGYNLVSLDETPFRVWKEARPVITLNEGSTAVNDYSEMEYTEAFETLFAKVSQEYPFTEEKGVDWQALHDEIAPLIASARNNLDFYGAMKAFGQAIPDGHVGISFDAEDFFNKHGGSFGMRLAELSDGRVIVAEVLPDYGADGVGIQPGAEIVDWDGQPVLDTLENVHSYFAPYSTAHAERQDKLIFLTRYPEGTDIEFSFRNPGEGIESVTLTAEIEYDSLFASIPSLAFDELALPLEAEILDDSGVGYIRITTFSDDYNLMAELWERFLKTLEENEVRSLIIDVRVNGGGSGGMASDFAGYFFDHEVVIGQGSYYNNLSGTFEESPGEWNIHPAPEQFNGRIAVLVGPNCVSACEAFAYMMQQEGRATIFGHTPSAGAFGEVGQGQYDLPGDYTMQFPTGRTFTPNGQLLLEGVGVIPDVVVPVTYESALGREDAVLDAAVEELAQ
jgi:C-terminal processing protease CtpA/Prc